jgi:UMP-CMP kinase
LRCYALASRAIWKPASVRSTSRISTRAKQLADFARGGTKLSSKLSGSSTSLEALTLQEKSFGSIAGSSVDEEFGGIAFHDSSNGYRVVFVLGGPGAGKGTQSDLMLNEYPCVHLSAGQLLRDETSRKDSPHAALIEECLVAGKIVPVEISLALLRNAMENASGKSLIFLVDGFPRNYDNLEGWANCMQSVANVLGVLVYQCPLSVLEERILERAKESGRSDDNLESLRKRFKTFEGDTMPIIETLRLLQKETAMNVWDIMGDQQLEKVWEETQDRMNSLVANDVLAANRELLAAVAKRNSDLYRSLCADEMFQDKSTEEVMEAQEGKGEFPEVIVMDAELNFISGKKVSVTYKRVSKTSIFQETRLWSYKELSGWRNVHYSRSPC